MTSLDEALIHADEVLPGVAAPEDSIDPRWQAIISVAEFIPSHPDEVWHFARTWGGHADADLRAAIATCVLEHLLEHHFEAVWPKVEAAVRDDALFAETFSMCWKFGQAAESKNAARMDQLKREIS
jgi:hypothetical protein